MPRTDGRIEKGQSLRSAISARAWNRAQDAADVVLGERTIAAAEEMAGIGRASHLIRVENTTNETIPIFGVLGIADPVIINPAEGTLSGSDLASIRAREFIRSPVLRGVAPVLSQHRERFVVAMEPIRSGSVGVCAASGIFACKVNVTIVTHNFATVKDGDFTQLQSATCGMVHLLWKYRGDDDPSSLGEDRWAIGAM
jgi:hypothetical protein